MYVTSLDARGLNELVLEVVSNSIDQFLGGGARQLRIDVSDAGWVTIEAAISSRFSPRFIRRPRATGTIRTFISLADWGLVW